MASSSFLDRFRRVTSSGRYLPEIDGLRFIAIVLVCLVFHQTGCLMESLPKNYFPKNALFSQYVTEGACGVSFFFMISGFILSLPFAEHFLLQKNKVDLKQYFWRRVTRLEPAYLISLTVYFVLRIWVLHYSSFSALLPHYIASFFYVHSIVYNDFSPVNGVTWSLEVEIQFYLLMPLLAGLFAIRDKRLRRMIFLILIIAGGVFSYQQQYQMGNVLNKGCYFIGGMLLADLFLLSKRNYDHLFYTFIAVLCLASFIVVPGYYVSIWYCLLKLFLMLFFFLLAIFNTTVKKILSINIIATIGGMCYSIYLIHMGVLGLLRHKILGVQFFHSAIPDVLLQYIISTTLILIVSGAFFLLIEKPTMKKDWYKHFFRKKKVAL